MNSKIKLFFCETGFSLILLFFGICNIAHGSSASEKKRNNTENNPQDLVVSGSVKDGETGEFVQSVNVIVKNTKIGLISNNSGTYKISVSDNNAVVVFSAVNYLTQEVQVNGKETIDIILQ